MPLRYSRFLFRLMAASLLACVSFAGRTQATGLLYDPEPPVDSAYVRVILASRTGVVDIQVDERPRIQKLIAGDASEYMVLTAGKHTLTVHPVGKSAAIFSTKIDVVQGRAMTVAFTELKPDAVPVIFEDKANSNKLKALLAVYHLDGRGGALDVLTVDGNTRVFSGVTYGVYSSIQVNPITIDLIATTAGEKVPRGRSSLAMKQGGTYSLLLLSGQDGKLLVRSVQNKIERYTGK
jgi:hypothetical protein